MTTIQIVACVLGLAALIVMARKSKEDFGGYVKPGSFMVLFLLLAVSVGVLFFPSAAPIVILVSGMILAFLGIPQLMKVGSK